MIATWKSLLERALDVQEAELASLRREQKAIHDEVTRYQALWHDPPMAVEDTSPALLIVWQQFGAASENHRKRLEEEDFIVESRIKRCQEKILEIHQQIHVLQEILTRREAAERHRFARRQLREVSQQAALRQGMEEALGAWHWK